MHQVYVEMAVRGVVELGRPPNNRHNPSLTLFPGLDRLPPKKKNFLSDKATDDQ